MNHIAPLFISLVTISPLMADSISLPVPRTFTSDRGSDVVFTMLPAKYFEGEQEAFGVAYRLKEDGSLVELYRTKGWFSFQVFISTDGRYLVRMGPLPSGHEPAEDDLAVAFYKDGKLLKEYSTSELVKDKSKVVPTTNHYLWRAPSPTSSDLSETEILKLRLHLDGTNVFDLHTIDGWTYSFDVTTGDINSTKRTKG